MQINLTFEQVSNLFRTLKDLKNRGEEYLDTVPGDLQSAIFDNEYSSCTGMMFDRVSEVVLGPELSDMLSYYLYETNHYITSRAKDYKGEEGVLEYIKDNYFKE